MPASSLFFRVMRLGQVTGLMRVDIRCLNEFFLGLIDPDAVKRFIGYSSNALFECGQSTLMFMHLFNFYFINVFYTNCPLQ